MSSPSLESFCCIYENYSGSNVMINGSLPRKHFFQYDFYNGLCLFSSSVSIVGALATLIPWKNCRIRRGLDLSREQYQRSQRPSTGYLKQIIKWLSLVDLLACLGIFVRSIVWLIDFYPLLKIPEEGQKIDFDFEHMFCAISSGWIHFFYVCTYFWTFCYALDVTFQILGKPSKPYLYHSLGFGASALISGIGLTSLYYPSILECQRDLENEVPHFLSAYIPMLLVMIANPCLYVVSISKAKGLITSRYGRYTDVERQAVLKLRDKFICVMVIFYVCWIPNVMNGILLFWYKSRSIDFKVYICVWTIMGFLNPLQAFFSSWAYRFCCSTGRSRIFGTIKEKAELCCISICGFFCNYSEETERLLQIQARRRNGEIEDSTCI